MSKNQNNSTITGTTPTETGSRWSRWGIAAATKGMQISDWASTYANNASAKIGGERFWPSSNDMVLEIEKCERILRAFTVEGIPDKQELEREEEFKDSKGNFMKKKRKVLKKIPPRILERAAGIVIYTGMRSGIAPFGGTGGTGLVLARLPNGSWSAPSAISPNNLSAGLLLGLDIFDAILVIRKPELMKSFGTHKFTLGAETAVVAGPVGAGASMESGIDKAPIFSYIRSRGLYAGIEIMGQVFVDRFDENERYYHWPGIKAQMGFASRKGEGKGGMRSPGSELVSQIPSLFSNLPSLASQDILEGKVHIPPAAIPLHRALRDAETGVAQGGKLEKTVYDVVKVPQNDAIKALGIRKAKKKKENINGKGLEGEERLSDEKVEGELLNRGGESDEILISRTEVDDEDEGSKRGSLASSSNGSVLKPPPLHPNSTIQREEEEDSDEDFLEEGERLRLPPTPQELDALEAAGIPDEEDLKLAAKLREEVYELEIPPRHAYVKRYLDARPKLAASYPKEKPRLNGRGGPEVRRWRRSLGMFGKDENEVEEGKGESERDEEWEMEKGRRENDVGEEGDLGEGGTTLMLNHGDTHEEEFSSREADPFRTKAHSLAQELGIEKSQEPLIAPTPPISETPNLIASKSTIEPQTSTSTSQSQLPTSESTLSLLPAFDEKEKEPSSSPTSPFNASIPLTKEDPAPYPESLSEEPQPKRRSLFLSRDDTDKQELELLKGNKEEEDDLQIETPASTRSESWYQDEEENQEDEYSRGAESRFEKLANSVSSGAGIEGAGSLEKELEDGDQMEKAGEDLKAEDHLETEDKEDKVQNQAQDQDQVQVEETSKTIDQPSLADELNQSTQEQPALESIPAESKEEEISKSEAQGPTSGIEETHRHSAELPAAMDSLELNQSSQPQTPPQSHEPEDLKTPSRSQFESTSIPFSTNAGLTDTEFNPLDSPTLSFKEENEDQDPNSSGTQKATDTVSQSHSHSDSLHSVHSTTSVVTSAEEESFASAQNSEAGSEIGDVEREKEVEKQKIVEGDSSDPIQQAEKLQDTARQSSEPTPQPLPSTSILETEETPSTSLQEPSSESEFLDTTSSPNPASTLSPQLSSVSSSPQIEEEPSPSLSSAASLARSPSLSSTSSGQNNAETPNGSTRGSVRSITDASLLPPPSRPPRRARGKK